MYFFSCSLIRTKVFCIAFKFRRGRQLTSLHGLQYICIYEERTFRISSRACCTFKQLEDFGKAEKGYPH